MDGYPRRFGQYVLLKPLARGGMGALYLAVHGDRGTEKLCVVKTALHHLAGKGYVQRFKDEAKVVVRLSHGNLVTVFDTGEVDGEIYLAMDFVEGKDLRAVWNKCAQKGIAFPIDIAVHIVKELSRGLGYAHAFESLSLVHRDVSPPNVLLSYTGEVKLTDFGLATSTLKLEKTAPGIIYGKLSYMAPEQARRDALDARTDLYAAGIILWELLTGRQLFPASRGPAAGVGETEDELLEKVRNPKPVPPSQRAKRVPPELDRICMRALALAPAARYQSGEVFRAELAAFQAKTAPATDGEQLARFLRELFGEAIDKERAERTQLVAGTTAVASLETLRPQVLGPRVPRPTGKPEEAISASAGDQTTAASSDRGESAIVGTVLQGRYRIKRLCGEGGMGRVYEAEHVDIGKRVAVKVLHPAYSRTPEVVERFRREARAASKIGHQNIVNVTDSGTTLDGSFFFVMEYIEGVELGYVIHKEGPLAVERALRITDQICQALQAAHDVGVIHRDLKPENVLLVGKLGESDFVKVLDFGIAKSADVEESNQAGPAGRRLTRPGVAMGTPEYMAPEQAAGKSADARSDIYAVGSICYEMLTSIPPYDGDNVMEILHKKANEAPKPIREIRPELSPEVEDLVSRMMARNPNGRPPSMTLLAREIQGLIANLGNTQAPLTRFPTPRRESPLAGALEPGPAEKTPFSRPKMAIIGAALAALAGFVVVRATRPRGAAPVVTQVSPAPVAVPPVPVPPVAVPPALMPVQPEPVVVAPPPVASAPVPVERRATSLPPRPRVAPAVPGPQILDQGKKAMQAGHFDEARTAFTKLLDSSRNRGAALVGLGKIAFQEKKYPEAVKRAQEAVKARAGAEARTLLGDAYFRMEKYSDAIKAYEDALKVDPHNAAAKNSLERAKQRMN